MAALYFYPYHHSGLSHTLLHLMYVLSWKTGALKQLLLSCIKNLQTSRNSVFRYTFPKFTLCWTEFLGLKVRIPVKSSLTLWQNTEGIGSCQSENGTEKKKPTKLNLRENSQWDEKYRGWSSATLLSLRLKNCGFKYFFVNGHFKNFFQQIRLMYNKVKKKKNVLFMLPSVHKRTHSKVMRHRRVALPRPRKCFNWYNNVTTKLIKDVEITSYMRQS